MKKLLILLSLTSTTAVAHTGHLANESVHSFLHVEHIFAITAIGLTAYAIKLLRNK